MTHVSILKMGVWVLAASCILSGPMFAADRPRLDILADAYPRAFFFRAAEQACSERRYPAYEDWESQFKRLQGIMGKCLDEECIGREPRNPEFFTRFKREHPNQLVMLHFNGNARDPRYHTEPYFPGHWVYRRAVQITQDVAAQAAESLIHVEDASVFRVNAGRYRASNDDIALFGMAPDGKHDWHHCEQVQLLAVDAQANTIRVKRGCYGTQPLPFEAGKARAAAHQVEGPWGRTNNIMWYYNFSTHCPRDRQGRTCGDRLVDDLATWFGPGGKLESFDGLEFDVMFNQTRGDTDGDGVEDDGELDGVNRYGIGVVEFARKLRQRMGDAFIIQGDGALGAGGARSQRAWGILNGIESEGWPNLGDWEFEDWSGGLNRHGFWRDNGRPPAFSYINHKWNQAVPDQPGVQRQPDVPFARHRLVFAAGQFLDAAICYSFAPPPDGGGLLGVWDEFRGGTDNQLGWLGRPEGPAVHLAALQPDLLASTGHGAALCARISGPVDARLTPDGVRVTARDPQADAVRFSIEAIPAQGSDLVVFVKMQGDRQRGYPAEMARFAQVGVSGGMVDLMAGEPLEIGMKLRGGPQEVRLDSATGASLRKQQRSIAGATLPTYFTHPPYLAAKGYTYWTQEANVHADSELRFCIGMGDRSPERSDGVWFQVWAAVVGDDGLGSYQKIFEADTKEHRWLPQSVSLAAYANQRVRLKFVADCGPHDNATTDHAHWGAVQIVPAGTTDAEITELRQFMTWVNSRPFESTFYYHQVRSDAVDLALTIDGPEAVTIQSMSLHAYPDVMYRVFERGIVLANPGRSGYQFDLARLTPGRRYRRLLATGRQDMKVNNGQPVGSTVPLEERDGLFLKRVD